MRVLWAAAIIMGLAAPALAQNQPVPRYGDIDKEKSPQEIESDRQIEKAYRNSLGNISDKGPSDPWGKVRSVNAPQDPTKAAPVQRTRSGNLN